MRFIYTLDLFLTRERYVCVEVFPVGSDCLTGGRHTVGWEIYKIPCKPSSSTPGTETSYPVHVTVLVVY